MKSPQEQINAARIQKERIDEALPVAWALLIAFFFAVCVTVVVHVAYMLIASPLNCGMC